MVTNGLRLDRFGIFRTVRFLVLRGRENDTLSALTFFHLSRNVFRLVYSLWKWLASVWNFLIPVYPSPRRPCFRFSVNTLRISNILPNTPSSAMFGLSVINVAAEFWNFCTLTSRFNVISEFACLTALINVLSNCLKHESNMRHPGFQPGALPLSYRSLNCHNDKKDD